MCPVIIGADWADVSLPALILALIGIALGLFLWQRQPRARVRPFHHFKLVNESDKPITVAKVSGHSLANGGGQRRFPVTTTPEQTELGELPIEIPDATQVPPVIDSRTLEFDLPNEGPDYVQSLKFRVMAGNDQAEQDLSPIQVPPGGSLNADEYMYLYAVEATLKTVDASAAVYSYTFRVKSYYWVDGGYVLGPITSSYMIPPPPPPP